MQNPLPTKSYARRGLIGVLLLFATTATTVLAQSTTISITHNDKNGDSMVQVGETITIPTHTYPAVAGVSSELTVVPALYSCDEAGITDPSSSTKCLSPPVSAAVNPATEDVTYTISAGPTNPLTQFLNSYLIAYFDRAGTMIISNAVGPVMPAPPTLTHTLALAAGDTTPNVGDTVTISLLDTSMTLSGAVNLASCASESEAMAVTTGSDGLTGNGRNCAIVQTFSAAPYTHTLVSGDEGRHLFVYDQALGRQSDISPAVEAPPPLLDDPSPASTEVIRVLEGETLEFDLPDGGGNSPTYKITNNVLPSWLSHTTGGSRKVSGTASRSGGLNQHSRADFTLEFTVSENSVEKMRTQMYSIRVLRAEIEGSPSPVDNVVRFGTGYRLAARGLDPSTPYKRYEATCLASIGSSITAVATAMQNSAMCNTKERRNIGENNAGDIISPNVMPPDGSGFSGSPNLVFVYLFARGADTSLAAVAADASGTLGVVSPHYPVRVALALTIANNDQTVRTGEALASDITLTPAGFAPSATITYSLETGTFPSGLSLDSGTGSISGTVAETGVTPQNYVVTVTATAGSETVTSSDITITVELTPPGITITHADTNGDTAISKGDTLTISVAGGLSIADVRLRRCTDASRSTVAAIMADCGADLTLRTPADTSTRTYEIASDDENNHLVAFQNGGMVVSNYLGPVIPPSLAITHTDSNGDGFFNHGEPVELTAVGIVGQRYIIVCARNPSSYDSSITLTNAGGINDGGCGIVFFNQNTTTHTLGSTELRRNDDNTNRWLVAQTWPFSTTTQRITSAPLEVLTPDPALVITPSDPIPRVGETLMITPTIVNNWRLFRCSATVADNPTQDLDPDEFGRGPCNNEVFGASDREDSVMPRPYVLLNAALGRYMIAQSRNFRDTRITSNVLGPIRSRNDPVDGPPLNLSLNVSDHPDGSTPGTVTASITDADVGGGGNDSLTYSFEFSSESRSGVLDRDAGKTMINPTTGELTVAAGSNAGTAQITITATDRGGDTATQIVNITVNTVPLTDNTDAAAVILRTPVGVSVEFDLPTSGGVTPSYEVTGGLPTWLSHTTGTSPRVSGAPPTGRGYPFTLNYRVTNSGETTDYSQAYIVRALLTRITPEPTDNVVRVGSSYSLEARGLDTHTNYYIHSAVCAGSIGTSVVEVATAMGSADCDFINNNVFVGNAGSIARLHGRSIAVPTPNSSFTNPVLVYLYSHTGARTLTAVIAEGDTNNRAVVSRHYPVRTALALAIANNGQSVVTGNALANDITLTPAGFAPGATLTYAIASGALPSGLSLDAATGTISGSVDASGVVAQTYTLTVTATAGNETVTSGSITITVEAPAFVDNTSSTQIVARALSGDAVSFDLPDVGGNTPSYEITSQTFEPPASSFTLNHTTGTSRTVTGTPGVGGRVLTVNYTAREGSQSRDYTQEYIIRVLDAGIDPGGPALTASGGVLMGNGYHLRARGLDTAEDYNLFTATCRNSISSATVQDVASAMLGADCTMATETYSNNTGLAIRRDFVVADGPADSPANSLVFVYIFAKQSLADVAAGTPASDGGIGVASPTYAVEDRTGDLSSLSVSGMPEQNATLTVTGTVTDPDSTETSDAVSALTYAWEQADAQSGDATMPDSATWAAATGTNDQSSYTIAADGTQVNKFLRVRVGYSAFGGGERTIEVSGAIVSALVLEVTSGNAEQMVDINQAIADISLTARNFSTPADIRYTIEGTAPTGVSVRGDGTVTATLSGTPSDGGVFTFQIRAADSTQMVDSGNITLTVDRDGMIAAISGTVAEGSSVTAGAVTDPDGTVSAGDITYAWEQADAQSGDSSMPDSATWAAAPGSNTANPYAIASDQSQVGKFLRVMASYTVFGGGTLTSAAVGPIANTDDTGSIAAISGTPMEGMSLTAGAVTDPDGDPDPASITYQWQQSADGSTPWTDIASATNATYAIANDQSLVGMHLRVVAMYPEDGATRSLESTSVGPVTNLNADGAIAAISGNPMEGQTLTAGAVTDPDGDPDPAMVTYQWQQSADGSTPWTDIASATTNTYAIANDQSLVGMHLRVVATYSEGADTRTLESDSVGPVTNLNADPVITSTAETLTPAAGATGRTSQALSATDSDGDSVSYAAVVTTGGNFVTITRTDSATGVVTFDAVAEGNASITITASDGNGGSATLTLSVNVGPAPVLVASPTTQNKRPGNTIDTITLTPSNFSTPGSIVYSIATGTLPDGVSLDSSAGTISGRIGASVAMGDYTVTVTGTVDADGESAPTGNITVSVGDAPTIAANPTTQDKRPGNMIDLITLMPTNFTTPASITYAVTTGTLPMGITLTGATISGRIDPSVAMADYTVTVTGEVTADGESAIADVTISVGAAPQLAASPATQTKRPGNAIEPITLTPTNFTTPASITYAVTTGTLPMGISLAGPTISGTIDASVAEGDHTVTITGTVSGDGESALVEVTISVSTAPDLVASPTTQNKRPGNTIDTITMTPTNFTNSANIVYLLTGDLPTGVTFDTATGEISGRIDPSVAMGDYTVTVTGTVDADGESDTTGSITISVGDAPNLVASPTTQNKRPGNMIDPITMTPSNFTNSASIVYALNGTLPDGVTLNTTTGEISGRIDPSVAMGNYTVTVTGTVADAGESAPTGNITISVGDAPNLVASPTTQNKRPGNMIDPITMTPSNFTNSANIVYSLTGDLPTGVTIDATTGEISGTIDASVAEANYKVTVTAAVTADGESATADVTISVGAAPAIAITTNASQTVYVNNGTANAIADVTLTASNFTNFANIVYTIASGSLPEGLTLGGNGTTTATISGTPSATEDFSFRVRAAAAEDGESAMTSADISIQFGSNNLPTAAAIPQVTITAGGSVTRQTVFNANDDGDSIVNGSYRVAGISHTPSDVEVVRATVNEDGVVTLRGNAVGSARVTISVRDSRGGVGTTVIGVTVNPAPAPSSSSSSSGIIALAIIGAGAYIWWKKYQAAKNGNLAALAFLPDVDFALDHNDNRAFYTKLDWKNAPSSNWQLRTNMRLHNKYDGELLDWKADSHIGYQLRGDWGSVNPYAKARYVNNNPHEEAMQETYTYGLNLSLRNRVNIQIVQPDSEVQRYSLNTQWQLPNRFSLRIAQPNSELENYSLGLQWQGKRKIRYSLQGDIKAQSENNVYRLISTYTF